MRNIWENLRYQISLGQCYWWKLEQSFRIINVADVKTEREWINISTLYLQIDQCNRQATYTAVRYNKKSLASLVNVNAVDRVICRLDLRYTQVAPPTLSFVTFNSATVNSLFIKVPCFASIISHSFTSHYENTYIRRSKIVQYRKLSFISLKSVFPFNKLKMAVLKRCSVSYV
jgi:hypothetical protein